MSRRQSDDLLLWGGAAALAGLALWKGPAVVAGVQIVAGTVGDLFERGTRLNDTTADGAGVVPDDPDELLAQASALMGYEIDPDAYALARMGRSEGTDGRAARMHVALNDLRELQRIYGTRVYSSAWALMLRSKSNAAANGHFSAQHLGKRYATTRDPYAGDVRLAERVLAEHAAGVDPTGGALKFVDVDSFGVQTGTGSYEETAAAWAADGLEPATVDGASSNFVVFRRA